MNFYRLLSLVSGHKLPPSLKVLGLATLHLLHRRSVAVYLDPVTGCNLRCRMCYFSSPKHDSRLRSIHDERLKQVADAFFHRAMKVQIGCGTEPSLYPKLLEIIRLARNADVPFVSMTTNGQLLASNGNKLNALVEAGLNEITISAHGTKKNTYEYLMPGAKFERFESLLALLSLVKNKYPDFIIRLNFTFNSLNIEDLRPDNFSALWHEIKPDIVQLRPVQDIGGIWTDYNIQVLKERYGETIGKLREYLGALGVTVIAPDKEQLDSVNDTQDWASSIIEDVSYCYVSPDSVYKPDFIVGKDTYESYHRRCRTLKRLLQCVLGRRKGRHRNATKKLNYTVK